MPPKTSATQKELRGMQLMRKRGKTTTEIANTFHYSQSYVSKLLNGTYKPHIEEPKTIRQILQEQRTKEEAEKAEREKGWCKLYCCNDRQNCTDIKEPQNCLVWQLYNQKGKKGLRKQVLVDRRKKQCQKTH